MDFTIICSTESGGGVQGDGQILVYLQPSFHLAEQAVRLNVHIMGDSPRARKPGYIGRSWVEMIMCW